MRRTKIICTLGPATDEKGIVRALIEEGMDVARFNFSHGDYEEQARRMSEVKVERERLHRYVATLLDTKGPEIRLKQFVDGKVTLAKGQEFTLTTREVSGTNEICSITYQGLCKDIQVGARILIDDGLIELIVKKIENTDIVCEVINGGVVSNKKGINVPDANLSMPYVSAKDREDIIFGILMDFDYIAASFVREPKDVLEIREILDQNGGESIKIIAKIENRQGVDNIDQIIEVVDGIMIARGDMGVEIPYEEVPIIQKMIIKKVYNAGKIVITATQMLDSMMKNPRPTRAETTDVANAIYDGTSAIMLSGETAAGLYPINAVRTMVRIAEKTEDDIDYKKRFFREEKKENLEITDAISHATCTTAYDISAKAIVTVSKSGRSARMISKYRPNCNIIGCCTDVKVCRQLSMSWGVIPVLLQEKREVFELFTHAVEEAKRKELLQTGDVVVITSGVPIGVSGTTNMMKVEGVL